MFVLSFSTVRLPTFFFVISFVHQVFVPLFDTLSGKGIKLVTLAASLLALTGTGFLELGDASASWNDLWCVAQAAGFGMAFTRIEVCLSVCVCHITFACWRTSVPFSLPMGRERSTGVELEKNIVLSFFRRHLSLGDTVVEVGISPHKSSALSTAVLRLIGMCTDASRSVMKTPRSRYITHENLFVVS